MTEYMLFDRSALPRGPWSYEPDKLVWIDDATGLDCMIVRAGAHLGHLCGYVGVPPSHPWHGKDYSECTVGCDKDDCDHAPGDNVRVHGGLNYADACQGNICHEPEAGRPHDVWWFGFDCGHAFDLSPGMRSSAGGSLLAGTRLDGEGEYRTIDYVRAECASLAAQIAEATKS